MNGKNILTATSHHIKIDLQGQWDGSPDRILATPTHQFELDPQNQGGKKEQTPQAASVLNKSSNSIHSQQISHSQQ